MSLEYCQIAAEPRPCRGAVVRAPQVRFTLLTSRLIRMEYSPTEEFEDHASQAFWYRCQPVPEFTVTEEAGVMVIETQHLLLRYAPSARGFTPVSLSIHVKATDNTWHFGEHIWKSGDLKGTARTLDETNGFVALESGLMARSGWAIVDDSRSLVFDEQSWLVGRSRPENLDLYFFGYGHDYVGCLQDFQKVSGQTPLIPRWLLGNWWSRFWAYTQEELQRLMEDFAAHAVPLAVCIIDMDWHIVQTGNQSVGWTGYTWNRKLFPDPQGLIDWLHAKGLRTALNLHPADGIFPHEEQYAAMAAAAGIDPSTMEPVPFDIANREFGAAYFEQLHHPAEAHGVDFWWLDWQQGTQSKMRGLDPLWWLNHLHFYDLGRDGKKRPFIFSRWGGLGNHRYPIGFSGDTVVSWESLAFQPYFTATAANVGYGWWSHDIGGHMWGVEEGELYARWVQYGVFSPFLRLHSSNSPYSERRPWAWGRDVEAAAREAMQLRHALIPYIYTMAWRNTTVGIPLVTPLYYSHPEVDDAYACPQEYWFGRELIAAPFTAPAAEDVGLSRQRVWLPEGEWWDFFSGERREGGWHTVYGDLTETPVYARAGAIVPMGPKVPWGGLQNPDTLYLHVFPGADNRLELYEDDGATVAYKEGRYALTPIEVKWQGDRMEIAIGPMSGDVGVTVGVRRWIVVVHGVVQPEVEVAIGSGALGPVAAEYDVGHEAVEVTLEVRAVEGARVVLANEGGLVRPRDRREEGLRRLLHAFKATLLVKDQMHRDFAWVVQGKVDLARYGLTPGQREAVESVVR